MRGPSAGCRSAGSSWARPAARSSTGPPRRPAPDHGRGLGGGSAVATLVTWALARRRRSGGPALVGVAVVAGGLVALGLAGAVAARRRRRRCATLRVALVQGGGRARAHKDQVAPATRLRRPAGGDLPGAAGTAPAPGWCCGPRTWSPWTGPLAGSPQAAVLARLARAAAHHAGGRRHRAGVGHDLPQPGRGLGPRRQSWPCSRRCTGCPSASTCPSGRSSPTWPTCPGVATRRGAGPRQRADAHPGRPARGLVSFEVFYAGRSRSSVRAGAELLVVPTNTSSYATTGARTRRWRPTASRPCRRAGTWSRPRRPATARSSPSVATSLPAARSAAARCSPPSSPCAAG